MEAASLTAGVLWLVGMPVLLRRVKADYEGPAALSTGTVFAVWVSYALLTAAVVLAAVDGAWSLGLGTALALGLGLPLMAIGLALDLAGVAGMTSMAQMNGRESGELITGGVYRFSRNPQNVGIAFAGLGAAALGDSGLALLWVLAGAGAFFVYVAVEEAHLERQFGESFRRYKERAPRYLGLPSDDG